MYALHCVALRGEGLGLDDAELQNAMREAGVTNPWATFPSQGIVNVSPSIMLLSVRFRRNIEADATAL